MLTQIGRALIRAQWVLALVVGLVVTTVCTLGAFTAVDLSYPIAVNLGLRFWNIWSAAPSYAEFMGLLTRCGIEPIWTARWLIAFLVSTPVGFLAIYKTLRADLDSHHLMGSVTRALYPCGYGFLLLAIVTSVAWAGIMTAQQSPASIFGLIGDHCENYRPSSWDPPGDWKF